MSSSSATPLRGAAPEPADIMAPKELAHINAFRAARNWPVFILAKRMYDEQTTANREHKYGRTHPYITGMHFVLHYVRRFAPCAVLDIGSPLAQNVALAAIPGVEVTVLDVRPNADAGDLDLCWQTASAIALPFADASWSIVTSLWVMGHVGDGRYGDEFNVDGDKRMLEEVARVLRPGGIALLGPGLIDDECGNIFNLHRIYSWDWLVPEFERVGLNMIDRRDLPVADDVFMDYTSRGRRPGTYGVAVLKKK